jgi:hypothetical protein
MSSDPTEPDRSAAAPPGAIDLPLHGAAPGGATASSSFSPGPSAPPVGAGAPSSAGPVDEDAAPLRLVGHRRQRVVAVGIAATALLSVVAVSLLYYRWATKSEPTVAIVAWGRTAAWDGARVTVRGTGLRAPLRSVLRADDNLMVRFHVPPGEYVVRAEDPRGGLLEESQMLVEDPRHAGRVWWPFRMPPREAGAR